MDTLKLKIMDAFNSWLSEIESSSDGSTVIDIASEFEKIFSRNIITIAFGEDISDEKFEMQVPTEMNKYDALKPKVVSMREALHVTNDLIVNTAPSLFTDPRNWFFSRTGKLYPVTQMHHEVNKNAATVRQKIRDYVRDRKSGKRESKVKDKVDLLSLFFERPDVFTEEFIVDEMVDFFVAASVTTQAATQTIVSHFIKDP